MASKTAVSGNRVSIDDVNYDLTAAGTDRWAVCDEFGGALGYFQTRGKAVVPDDWGVEGAHAIVTIAKLWLASAEPVVAKPSLMVCRTSKSEGVSEADVEQAKAYATWLKKAGAKAAFVSHDAETNKLCCISVWSSRGKLTAALEQPVPTGAAEPASSQVEISPLAQDF